MDSEWAYRLVVCSWFAWYWFRPRANSPVVVAPLPPAKQAAEISLIATNNPMSSSLLKVDDSPVTPLVEAPFDRAVHIEAQGNLDLALVEKTRELVVQDEPNLAGDEWVLGDAAVWRYLVARKLDVQGARKQMVASLKWRELRQPDTIRPEDVKLEIATGKCAVRGLDQYSRPVIVLDPSKENTHNMEGNMKGLMFTLNRAIDSMQPPVQKYVVVVRLGETSAFNFSKLPGPAQTKETAKILMTVFAERMGHAVLYQPPKIFTMFLNLLSNILDAHVMEKIIWVRGDVSVGSANDLLMINTIGPNWREIVAFDRVAR
ncbi:hypothetical protein BASA81_015375 [Batrachochytrium salamandrivorans]|nr:hypothetical protein BASA81_015375 [Batrachochytrium salamandrivorans]